MRYDFLNNNKVFLCGIVVEKPVFSHETYGEGFYEVKLSVSRLSDNSDVLPVTVSEKFLKHFVLGKEVSVRGQMRSFNKVCDGKSRLVLSVFVREVIEKVQGMNPNIIELSGFLCKAPVFRVTPFNREICDILIAVNRAYNKSDYLPCIAWGRNANYIKDAPVGQRVELVGRIQSRDYQKTLPSGEVVKKTAYEISVNRITMVEEAKCDAGKNA